MANSRPYTISQYSDKSIVVRKIGEGASLSPSDTDILNLGGKFNKFLKGGEGWIFPNFKRDQIDKYIQNKPKPKKYISCSKVEKAIEKMKKEYEKYPNNLKIKGGSIVKKLKDCNKTVLSRHFEKYEEYIGWQVNVLVENDISIPKHYSVSSMHDYTDFIYADFETVKKWMVDKVIIDNPYGPIEKKYTLFDGKMGVYFKSFYTGD